MRDTKLVICLAVMAVLFVGLSNASADLIGISWNDSRLFSFDPTLGTITQYHVQLNENENFRGLTYVPNRSKLYALSQSDLNLYSIDTVTLNIELVGTLEINEDDVGGLTYNPVTDTLYTSVNHRYPNLSSELVTVDLDTAEVAAIGMITNGFCNSLSYNETNGQFNAFVAYGSGSWDSPYKSSMVSINPDNAAMTTLFETPYHAIMGLAKKPGEDIFYSWVNWTSHTYGEVDLSSQTVTLLGNSDDVGVSSDAMIYKDFYVAVASEPASVLYVDDSATDGDANGASWEDAFLYLQDALAAAIYGDEIRVAQGVYKPDRNAANPGGTGDREASFNLVNGTVLKGGYAGFGASDPDERNIEQYETILSGDLLANDSSNYASANFCDEDPNLTDNCYNVITSIGTNNDTIIDGFSITGGYAFVDWEMYGQESMGAGLYNSESDLTIIHCVFRNNISYASGIAIYNQNANPQILSCTFATNVDHGYPCVNPEIAHGVINNVDSSPVISGCRFSHNRAFAIGNTGGAPVIENCIFEYNHGVSVGAIENRGTHVEIRNCSFIHNGGRATGAIFNWDSATSIKHCIFADNSSYDSFYPGEGGTICVGESNLSIENCTFYGNYGAPLNGDLEETFVTNCIFYKNFTGEDPNNIVDGPAGPYNYNEDALLADPNNGDFHLKSECGRWNSNSQTWVYDDVTSPCIDAGDPADPNWMNELWPHGKRINMGAYGRTSQASKSSSAAGNIADFTFDDCVGLEDLAEFFDQWLTCQILIPEDMDWDGCVDLPDFSLFAQNWLLCPAQDLVGWWQFNETTGNQANDSSIFDNHGTLVNGPVWTGDGKLQVDGVDDYVQVPDSESLTCTNQITLSAWVMLTEDNIRFMKIVIQPANAASADPWENYCIDLRRKNPRFILSAGTPGSWNGVYDATWNSPVTVGAWYHLAGTYDGSTMILYVNGEPTQSKAVALTVGNNELPLYIGSAFGTNGFGGLIDEVRIYNRSLNEIEIQNLYQNH